MFPTAAPTAVTAAKAAISFLRWTTALIHWWISGTSCKYVAQSGEEGGKRRCHGADGKDLIVKVPEGTVVKDLESGKVITDMSGDNRREIILKGGRGGLGNMHFATSTMQVPKYAQPGQPGQELWIQLELKVIADVGLVGFPNVGKSTLAFPRFQRKAKDRQLSFYYPKPALGRL